MGDPRRLKKTYERPRKPWDKERIEAERELMKKYGLRRKHELWKAEAVLRKIKRAAREAIGDKYDKTKEERIIKKVVDLGLLKEGEATLDNILELTVEDILERRLQTMVYKLGLANTPLQARQFIVHGHVLVDGIRVVSPKFHIKAGMEDKIEIAPNSPVLKIIKQEKEEPKKKKQEKEDKQVKEKAKEEAQKQEEDKKEKTEDRQETEKKEEKKEVVAKE